MEKHNYVRLVIEFHSLPDITRDQVSALRAAVEQAVQELHPKARRKSDVMVTIEEPNIARGHIETTASGYRLSSPQNSLALRCRLALSLGPKAGARNCRAEQENALLALSGLKVP